MCQQIHTHTQCENGYTQCENRYTKCEQIHNTHKHIQLEKTHTKQIQTDTHTLSDILLQTQTDTERVIKLTHTISIVITIYCVQYSSFTAHARNVETLYCSVRY